MTSGSLHLLVEVLKKDPSNFLAQYAPFIFYPARFSTSTDYTPYFWIASSGLYCFTAMYVETMGVYIASFTPPKSR